MHEYPTVIAPWDGKIRFIASSGYGYSTIEQLEHTCSAKRARAAQSDWKATRPHAHTPTHPHCQETVDKKRAVGQ